MKLLTDQVRLHFIYVGFHIWQIYICIFIYTERLNFENLPEY